MVATRLGINPDGERYPGFSFGRNETDWSGGSAIRMGACPNIGKLIYIKTLCPAGPKVANSGALRLAGRRGPIPSPRRPAGRAGKKKGWILMSNLKKLTDENKARSKRKKKKVQELGDIAGYLDQELKIDGDV